MSITQQPGAVDSLLDGLMAGARIRALGIESKGQKLRNAIIAKELEHYDISQQLHDEYQRTLTEGNQLENDFNKFKLETFPEQNKLNMQSQQIENQAGQIRNEMLPNALAAELGKTQADTAYRMAQPGLEQGRIDVDKSRIQQDAAELKFKQSDATGQSFTAIAKGLMSGATELLPMPQYQAMAEQAWIAAGNDGKMPETTRNVWAQKMFSDHLNAIHEFEQDKQQGDLLQQQLLASKTTQALNEMRKRQIEDEMQNPTPRLSPEQTKTAELATEQLKPLFKQRGLIQDKISQVDPDTGEYMEITGDSVSFSTKDQLEAQLKAIDDQIGELSKQAIEASTPRRRQTSTPAASQSAATQPSSTAKTAEIDFDLYGKILEELASSGKFDNEDDLIAEADKLYAERSSKR